MKNRVVCISKDGAETCQVVAIGDLYEIESIHHMNMPGKVPGPYYKLKGIADGVYHFSLFRPVDNTFGEVVAEIIEKQVEVEEMEKISV